jgi:lipopolysaccharide biosynthesis glycosyltransferase
MKNDINIFFASDDEYAPFVAVAMTSICYNTKESIKFYIIEDGISKFHKQLISSLTDRFSNCTVSFFDINTKIIFDKFFLGIENRITFSTYSRFLIPQLVKDIDRSIYLDADIICLGNIAELYEHDLDEFSLGAIGHAFFKDTSIAHLVDNIYTSIDLNPKLHNYFNAGVLLIDCNAWREQDITKKLLYIASTYKKKLSFADQCTLNICFSNNNYKELDRKYDFMTQDCNYFFNVDKVEYARLARNALIRHFESSKKPWLTDTAFNGKSLENFQDFWFFAAMTPFYAGLQQQFTANMIKKTFLLQSMSTTGETQSSKRKLDKNMLAALRAKVVAAKVCDMKEQP